MTAISSAYILMNSMREMKKALPDCFFKFSKVL